MEKNKFKQTEIGHNLTSLTTGIPEGWEERELGSLGEIVTGKTPHTIDKDNFGTEYPFITPRDMKDQKYIESTERYLSEKGKNEVNNCIVPGSTICVSCIGSDMGKVVMTRRPSITNQQLNSIVPQNINPDFIYYAVAGITDQMRDVAFHSTAVPILNKSSFSRFKILVPKDNKERDKISKILSDLDEKIELNHQMNKTLESIAQVIFKRWFADFKFPGYEKTKNVNGLPKGWRRGRFGELAKIQPGFAFKSADFTSSGYKVIKITNIQSGIVDFAQSDHITDAVFQSVNKKFHLASGDVIIAMTGAEIGKIGIIPENNEIALLNQRVGKLVSDYYIWAYYMLKGAEIQSLIYGISSASSAQPNISNSDIERTEVVIPDIQTLKYFCQAEVPLFKCIISNLGENKVLSQIRDSLLPRLMSGKIRVN